MHHSVVAIQETKGCDEDMLMLPSTHQYSGSFAMLTGPASSPSGGVVVAIHKALIDRATQSYTTTHSRGRAMTVSLCLSTWVHVTTLNVEPALPFGDKRRLLARIADWHTNTSGLKILLGDCNFLASDECRMAENGTDLISDNNMGAYFDDRFPMFIELMQRGFTFRRLSREVGGASVFSRIDRVYIEVHPTAMEDVTATVTVRGDIDRRTAPSDHKAVCVSLSLRAHGRRVVQPQAIANTRYRKVLTEEMGRHGTPPTAEAHTSASSRLAPSIGAAPTPHQMVEVALRIVRLHRSARTRGALQLAGAFPQTREAVDAGVVDLSVVGRVLHENLDKCIALDVAEVERSRMPELMKAAKEQKIRWRAEPYRPKRKRLILHGIYTRDGVPIDGDDEVSRAIVDERAPVFEGRATDEEEEIRFFADFIMPGCGATAWAWPRGTLSAVAERCTHSAPGPDGVPYAFWAQAPQEVLEILENASERMSRGIRPPAQLLDSLTIFIPKGEYAADLERVIRRINELRPITLMQTSAKLIAGVVNLELSDIAKRTIVDEQRGFVEGRTIGDNVIEMEGALYEYSQLCDSMAAIVLLDFAQAFPSLSHRWMLRVLRTMGINEALLATIEALYDDLITYVFHNGRKLHPLPIRAGIKQGCPLSGSLFAVLCAGALCQVATCLGLVAQELEVRSCGGRGERPAVQGLHRRMRGGGGHAGRHCSDVSWRGGRSDSVSNAVGVCESQSDQEDAGHPRRSKPAWPHSVLKHSHC